MSDIVPMAEQPKNGILAYVGGHHIAGAGRMLPVASEAEAYKPLRSVVIDVPDLGPVRITFALNAYRHRAKSKFWHWLAQHAEKVQTSA